MITADLLATDAACDAHERVTEATAALGATMEIVPEVLVYRRLHPANLTRQAGHGVRHALVDAVHESLRRRRQQQAENKQAQSNTGPTR